MNTIKCPNCGYENKNTNIRCELCKTELNYIDSNNNFLNRDYSQQEYETSKSKKAIIIIVVNAILLLMFAPFLVVGIFFTVKSFDFSSVDGKNIENYLETEGRLVDYDMSGKTDDGRTLYKGIYEYKVNGITYKGSPNYSSTIRSDIEENVKVKYNDNNPNEYVIDLGFNIVIFLCGIIAVSIALMIIIPTNIFIIKIFKMTNQDKKIEIYKN